MGFPVECLILVPKVNLSGAEELGTFQDHFDYMDIIMITSSYLWIAVQVEYVHATLVST